MARHVVCLVEVVLTLVLLPVFVILQPLGLLVGPARVTRRTATAPQPQGPSRTFQDPCAACPGTAASRQAACPAAPSGPVSHVQVPFSTPSESGKCACVR
jgi:hypothetical protein